VCKHPSILQKYCIVLRILCFHDFDSVVVMNANVLFCLCLFSTLFVQRCVCDTQCNCALCLCCVVVVVVFVRVYACIMYMLDPVFLSFYIV